MTTIALINTTFGLRRAGILSMQRADGLRVQCRSGLLWVTAQDDPTDYWLRNGQSVTIRSPGRVLIQAEEDSWLDIGRPAEERAEYAEMEMAAAA
jgi:hypothetical protein